MSTEHMQSLELANAGDWDGAHQLIQNYHDPLACMIHAYLHREEGDDGNAAYWYHRAGTSMPDNTLQQEYQRLYQLAQQG